MKGGSASLLQWGDISAAAAFEQIWGMASSLGNLPPWEETVLGTSRGLDGRAGMAEVEAKAPAQQISKGMKGGCSRPACRLAEATTSLSPNTSWLIPKHLLVPMDMSHLPQGGWE